MFEIPASELGFKILNANKPGDLQLAIESFLEGAKAEKLSILDVSFASRGDELLVVFFFRIPKN
ncbi:MAG: hypothetical protein JW967_04575 [Dehalococcoidales bacterium]|nr:hypothetical protein [Dehalococcoidales bacterium]